MQHLTRARVLDQLLSNDLLVVDVTTLSKSGGEFQVFRMKDFAAIVNDTLFLLILLIFL